GGGVWALRSAATAAPAAPLPDSWIFGGYQWLGTPPSRPRNPFLLASIARILYPVRCLACERPWPCFGWAHDPETLAPVFRTDHARTESFAQGTSAKWPMLSSSAPSGATRGRARSSTGCRSRLTSLCVSRGAKRPPTRWQPQAKHTT